MTTYRFNEQGRLLAISDLNGNTTELSYDRLHLTKVSNPCGSLSFSYDFYSGKIVKITDHTGRTASYKYNQDNKHFLVSAIQPSGAGYRYEYGTNGKICNIINPLDITTIHNEYDERNRTVKQSFPDGGVATMEYDDQRRSTITTEQNGNEITYVHDEEFRTTRIIYDDSEEQFEYNKKGEVVEAKSPLGQVVKFQYDEAGNVTSKLDEDGLETLYEYNLVRKLTKISYADGKTVEFSYDALKQLTAMQDWLGTTTITHDKKGQVTRVADFEGKEIGYAWDALGHREKLIYPDRNEVNYEYDTSGNLSKVAAGSDITSYVRDAMGRMRERILPDNTATKYEVNPLGQLDSLTHSKDGDILDQFRYSYDPVGNITRIEKNRAGIEADSGTFEYTYNDVGQLIAAVHGDQIKRYRYDELGNRVKSWVGEKYSDGESTLHSYNAMNQLIRTQEGDAVKEYGYDRRGNLTRITENGQLQASYTFDATNMMAEALAPGKGQAEYTYDGFRNRVKKLEELQGTGFTPDPVKEVRYVLDMTLPYDNLLMTQGQKGQNQRFTWGNDLISADENDMIYYLQDHLGSPIRLMGGDVVGAAIAYDEFGVPLAGGAHGNQKLNNPFGLLSRGTFARQESFFGKPVFMRFSILFFV